MVEDAKWTSEAADIPVGGSGALDDFLGPGERVVVSADGLLRVALHLFNRCRVVLTDRRLLVLRPTWPWGYGLHASYARAGLRVLNFKERLDRSQLLILEGSEGVVCLFFSRKWREEADLLRSDIAAGGWRDPT